MLPESILHLKQTTALHRIKMKSSIVTGVVLLVLVAASKCETDEQCKKDALLQNPNMLPCYDAVGNKDVDEFCPEDRNCVELLSKYFECTSGETRAAKEKEVKDMMRKCQQLESDGVAVGASLITSAVLMAVAATVN